MVVVSMSVREEDDSKSDTTQNLFKHSPVPPPPTPPPVTVADPKARCWDVFTPAGCLYVTAAAEKLSTVPTLSLPRSLAACRKSKSGYLAARPPARPPHGLEPGGRSTRGSPFAKMGAGAARRRSGRTDGSPLFSSTSHTCGAATGQRRRAGKRQAVRRASERASSPQC